ncbi:MAG: hypothetical protein HYV02_03860 [Deltaproteobacteria bacterium]|nr:hypothetical protein [Deltaproteobacteria bacterium]
MRSSDNFKNPVKPTAQDLERMRLYASLPAEAKLFRLDQLRRFMFEIWKKNPETAANREYLRNRFAKR